MAHPDDMKCQFERHQDLRLLVREIDPLKVPGASPERRKGRHPATKARDPLLPVSGLAGLPVHKGQQRGGNGQLQGAGGRRGGHRANAKGWSLHGHHLVGRMIISVPSTARVDGQYAIAPCNWNAQEMTGPRTLVKDLHSRT